MSYQVLARKWRPRTFREMVGQEHVLQALINALDHDRLHHAYLFTGTRGVGKTTIGRILAKCLNCEVGVSSAPCNECGACTEINDGRFVDLIEVDAASRTKVEDTRELLENVQYVPTRGRYKVYLIDEVHMLSNSSFNALLKTLEEPPPHVKFLLATTDPQKLPVTILSRCLQFNLKNMNPERIVTHLQFILNKEMVPFEDAGLWQLARAADGSMRDALSLTDQSIAFGDGKVTDADVRTMLGTIDQSIVFKVLEALVAEDGKALLAAVETLAEHAPDYSAALAEIIAVLHRIAIAQTLPEAVDDSQGDRQQIYNFAQHITAEDVQLYYQTALLGRRDLPLVPDPRSGFEMVLLRMLAFKPQGVAQLPTKKLNPQGIATSTNEAAAEQVPSTESQEAVAPPVESHEVIEPVKKPEAATLVADDHQDFAQQEAADKPHNARFLVESSEEPLQEETVSVVEQTLVEAHLAEPETLVDNVAHSVQEEQSIPVVEERVLTDVPTLEEAQQPPEIDRPSVDEIMSVVVEAEVKENHETENLEESKASDIQFDESVPRVTVDEFSSEHWLAVYSVINSGGLLQSTAANCQLVSSRLQEGAYHLDFILDQQQSTLYDQSHQQRLAELLSEYFAQPVQVAIQVGEVQAETPAQIIIRQQRERQRQAEQSIAGDPLVQELQTVFDATVIEDSIAPLDRAK